MIKTLFSFNIATVLGMIIGLMISLKHVHTSPLPPVLSSSAMYILCFFIVFAIQAALWVFLDKMNLSHLKIRFGDWISHYITLMIVINCTCCLYFIVSVFYK